MNRQMHLGLFILGTGSHVAGWRWPGAVTDFSDLAAIQQIGRTAERGRFDLIFMGDNLYADAGRPSVLHAAARAAHHDGGARDHHEARRPRRHRLDDLRRSVVDRARLRLARPYQRRPRGVECRHQHQPVGRSQLRQAAARPRRALRAGRGIHRGRAEAVGRVGRRRAGRRPRHRRLSRPQEAPRHQPCRQALQGEGPGQHRPQPAGPADRPASRRLGARPDAGGTHRRRGLHRDPRYRGIEDRLQGGEGPHAGVRPLARRAHDAARRDAGGRPHRQGGAREAATCCRASSIRPTACSS